MTSDRTPTQISRYKIIAEIGRGGFGRVYRAFDQTIGRSVAVKVLTEASQDVLSRFRNEAIVAANLHHENIVTVYEYGEWEGQPFLAMEYLEGEDLHNIIAAKKPLSLLQKCTIMSQVADGLYCAHRNGVVHRDVKPANIMVLPDGGVKIMDFGIARLTQDRDQTRLTQQGSVLGTLLYMSPEQLSGAEADVLSDIFAYGLIYFELLTGKHPFETPDSRAFMYKVSFEEPPPVRDFVPDFPDSLQRVISRTLQKDRELRYQSLREVQFDTEPIRIDLQQAHAADLLIQAKDLFQRKDLDPASKLVLEILSLDPANREARSLWENLQKLLQQRTLLPRIESLLQIAAEHLAARRFAEAVQNLETALRLDRENAEIQGRLEEARGLLERSRKAARVLVEARQELEHQNLTAAYRLVSEALSYDAGNTEAGAFLETVRGAMERHQRELRIDDAVHKAESLLLLHAYDEARFLLEQLGPDAASPQVQQVLSRIEQDKLEQERAHRLRSEMARASDLLRERRPVQAVECLEALRKDFPDNQEVLHMLSYAQLESEAQQRAEAIEKIAGEVSGYLRANQFAQALGVIETALNKYPGEGTLIRLLGSTIAAKADWERQQSVQAAVLECAQLRKQQRFAEAIELIDTTLRDYNAEPSLVALRQEVEKEGVRFKYAEAVRKAAEHAQSLLAQKQPEKAVHLLVQALGDTPDAPALLDLLNRARQEVQALETARTVEAIRREAASHAQARDYGKALGIIDRGLQNLRDNEVLTELREELLTAKAAWERQRAIGAAVERVNQLERAGQFEEALRLIASANRQYPGEALLAQLESRVSQAWEQQKRRSAVQSIASQARQLISQGSLDEAVEVLQKGAIQYPGEADLELLATQAREALQARKRTADIERCIKESRDLAAAGDFDRARQVVDQALETYAGDGALLRQMEFVRSAWAAWQRAQLIQQVVEQAGQLTKQGRFDDALKLLAKAAKGYEGEMALVEAQRQVEREKQEAQRRRAIAKTAAEVEGLLGRGDIDKALETLRGAYAQYPEEQVWQPLQARAEEALAARKRHEERRQAIQAVIRNANELARQGRFTDSLQLAAEAIQQYGGEPELLGLQTELQRRWEQQKRAEAVSRTAATAQASIEQGRFDEAIDALRKACTQYPGEAVLDSLLAQANAKLEARQHRDQVVREAEALLADDRFEEVIALVMPELEHFPGDENLLPILTRARERLEARRQVEAIEQLSQNVAALAEANDFDRALALIASGLQKWPGAERILRLQEATQAQKAAWQHEQALRNALSTAQDLGREKRFAEGLKCVEEALQHHPDEPALLQLRKEFRMRKGLVDADDLLNQSRPHEALKVLEDSASEYASEPEVASRMERARAGISAMAKAAAIEAQAKKAQARADAGDLEGALTIVERGLEKWLDAASLIQLQQTFISARADRQRQDAIRDAVRQCEEMEKAGHLEAALELTSESLKQFPDEPFLASLHNRLNDKLREEERRQELVRDLQALRSLTASLRETSALSRVSEIRQTAQGIAARHPDEKEIRAINEGLMRVLSDLEKAQAQLANHDHAAVLDICSRYAAEKPGYPVFDHLKERAVRGQKLDYLEELDRRVNAEPDLEVRVQLLEEGLKRYPDEKKISDDLRFIRNKLELVRTIVARARASEAAGSWDEALDHWKSLTAIYAQYPGLDAEIQRVQLARDRVRSEAIARSVEQIESQLQASDLGKAGEMLRQAQAQWPDNTAIQGLARRLEELKKKRKKARELLSQAQSTLDADWRRSEALVNEALSLEPGMAVPAALLQAISERKQEAVVGDTLSKATRMRTAGDLRGGLAEIERALSNYPAEPRLLSFKESLAAELRSARDGHLSQLRDIRRHVEAATQSADLESVPAQVRAIAAGYPNDAELRALAEETIHASLLRKRQIQKARFRSAFLASRIWIGGAAAGLAVAGGLWVGVRAWMNSHRDVTVTVQSSITGAAVSVAGKNCETPGCVLNLPPGAYTLTARKNGYQAITQPLAISARQSQVNVTVDLVPLPQLVQVNTNFESGRVFLDSRAEGALHDGQYTISGLSPGTHTLRVTGGGAEFQTRWKSGLGTSPQLLGSIVEKDVQAVVVANTGATGTITCNCGGQALVVDGSPAGETDPSGSSTPLKNLKEGSRRITIGGRALVVDVRPNPTLSVFLTLDRNVGTLIIDAAQDGAKIRLNGRIYPRTTEHGIVRVPLPVGTYTVRVEKDGFQAPPSQSVDVLKGEEKQVVLALTPFPPPFLELGGALPGAQVKVDGRAVGEIGSNGGLRVEVPRGSHTIELVKDGYATVRFGAEFSPGTTTRPAPNQIAMAKVVTTPPPPDPRQVEAQDWERVRNSNNADDFDDFVRKHSGGAHVDEARGRASQLRQQAQVAAARAAEQTAWDGIDKSKKPALQDFLSRYPNGAHAQDTRTLITAIDRQEADVLAAQRAREQREKEQEQAKQEQAKRAAADEQSINKTLTDYESAYNGMDLRAIQSIWPTIPKDTADKIRDQFRDARAILFRMVRTGPPVVNGEAATVDCTRSTTFTAKNGQRFPAVNDRVHVTLGRVSTGWAIRSITAF